MTEVLHKKTRLIEMCPTPEWSPHGTRKPIYHLLRAREGGEKVSQLKVMLGLQGLGRFF